MKNLILLFAICFASKIHAQTPKYQLSGNPRFNINIDSATYIVKILMKIQPTDGIAPVFSKDTTIYIQRCQSDTAVDIAIKQYLYLINQ